MTEKTSVVITGASSGIVPPMPSASQGAAITLSSSRATGFARKQYPSLKDALRLLARNNEATLRCMVP